MPFISRLLLVGLLLLAPVAPAANWLDAQIGDLEARRAQKLSPHQRAMAERILTAARDYESKDDDTLTLWIKAGRRDDDTVFIESVAEALWDTKAHLHLPLENLLGSDELIRKPRNIGSVLILENPKTDDDVYRDQMRLDGVLSTVMEEGHFAVVIFVDDRNILERLAPVLIGRLRVVDLTDAPACDQTLGS